MGKDFLKRNCWTLLIAFILGIGSIISAVTLGFPPSEIEALSWKTLVYIIIYALIGHCAFVFGYTIKNYHSRRDKKKVEGEEYPFEEFLKEVDLTHFWPKLPYAIFIAFGIYVVSMALAKGKVNFRIFIGISFITGLYTNKAALILSRLADAVTSLVGGKISKKEEEG